MRRLPRLHREHRTGRRLRRVPALASSALVALLTITAVGSFVTPNALGSYRVPIQNSQDTQAAGYFSCNQAVRMDTSYVAYAFDTLNGPNANPNTPNLGSMANAAAVYQSGASGDPDNITTSTNANGCVRDKSGFIRLTNAQNRSYSSFVNGPSSGFPAGLTSNNLTQEVWFRTATNYGRGGAIMSLGDTNFTRNDSGDSTKVSNSKDHQFFMDTSGFIHYVVWTGSEINLRSPTTLNDGNWHHILATTSTTNGMALWVDGQRVATSSATVGSTTSNAGNVTYLHIGYDNLNGWSGAPSGMQSWAFNGDIAYVGMYRQTFDARTVYMHYHAGLAR